MTDIVNGVLIRDKKVLMARRSDERENYPGTWSFPGGHVEEGETLQQALRREIAEELGVRVLSSAYLTQFDDLGTNRAEPVTFHFFTVRDWEGEPSNIGDEHSQIRWMSLTDAMQVPDLTFAEYVEVLEGIQVGRL